jgi:cell division protein FtsI (penicillin-binding protein 3)
MLVLKIALLLVFVVVALRLVQIQVLEAPAYRVIARRQYEAKIVLPATRGSIYDRTGRTLVSNTMFVSLGADPQIVGDRASSVAGQLARMFGKPKSFYQEKLTDPARRFVWLERRVKPEEAKLLDTSSTDGVIVLNEPQRMYHEDHGAAQLLGFTDVDNNGLSGIELEFNEQLKGADGYVVMQRDALGRRRPSVDYPRVDPVDGDNILLTIDLEYQAIAEEELRKGVERNKASSGLVIMLDPRTGEILAMANYPGGMPSNLPTVDPAVFKNRVITDMFEPGSVFKIVTASAAIENNLVRTDQKFFAEHGNYVIRLPGGKLRTITDTHPYGMLTFQEALEVSSNIVMAKVSNRIGPELLYTTARNFGFGASTGLELPGEASGELKKPSQWSGTTLNSIAIGYEVAVTPLQIAAAYAAVANSGILMKPYVVKQIVSPHGDVLLETGQQMIRRVVTETTARALEHLFEGVVERGTGMTARVSGIRVAGKTGTSRKVIDGKYVPGSYVATFAGFFPVEDPAVVCVVMLDDPKAGGYTGGLASAPIFKGIAEKVTATSGRFMRSAPIPYAGKQPRVVPDVSNLRVEVATDLLHEQGFEVERSGNGMIVGDQSPAPGTKLASGSVVRLSASQDMGEVQHGVTVVPDLRGLTVRRAVNRLSARQLDYIVEGSGIVAAQVPSAGERVKIGTSVTMRCAPRSLSMVTFY